MATPPISLCLIVRNEEANLPACLAPLVGLVDEVVVVDTGSTDATRQVATRLGARVVDFPWVDSFAAARNEALRQADGDWVLWLDADDRIDEVNRSRLQAVLAGLREEEVAYLMWTRLLWSSGRSTTVDHVRLFRKRPQVRWKYRVHEQLLWGEDWLAIQARPSEVVFEHLGYQDAGQMRRKEERNLRLLELDLPDHPEDSFLLFNLGWTNLRLGRRAEALPALQRCLQQVQPNLSYVRKLHLLLMQTLEELGRPQEALAVCLEARKRYPQDAEFLSHEQRLRSLSGMVVVRGW